jgi:hypothetical protein
VTGRRHLATLEVLADESRPGRTSRRATVAVGPARIAQLQAEAGNRAVLTLMRMAKGSGECGHDCTCPTCAGGVAPVFIQRDRTHKSPPSKTLSVGGGEQQVWIVRDRSIGFGGGMVVNDLEDFKKKVMRTADADGWTLVLAIHGSEDRLGAQSPPDWQKNAVFYGASDIDALFGQDKDFIEWRDKFGPTNLSLVSCQVSASFEGTLINNLTRTGDQGTRQPKRGLGEGCKPLSSTVTLNAAPGTKAQFEKLKPATKQSVTDELSELNKKWGYYGAPPIPDEMLVHYYYDEDPKGAWVTVEVVVDSGDHNPKSTGIPFWNRTFGPDAAKFRKLCTQGVGRLKSRESRAPRVPDE